METRGITNKTDRSGGSADEDKRASFQRLTRRAFLGSGAVAGTGAALTAPLLRQTRGPRPRLSRSGFVTGPVPASEPQRPDFIHIDSQNVDLSGAREERSPTRAQGSM